MVTQTDHIAIDGKYKLVDFPGGISSPAIHGRGRNFKVTWEKEGVEARVSKLYQHTDGRLSGEVVISLEQPERPEILGQQVFTLSSAPARDKFAKALNERRNTLDWKLLLERLYIVVSNKLSEGEPVVELCSAAQVETPQYDLKPLLVRHEPNLLFGDGGTFKSYLGLLLAICVTLPWSDNPFGWQVGEGVSRTLLLDYETNRDVVNWRAKCLINGLGLPDLSLYYRRCNLPLSEEIEQIQQDIMDNRIGLVIVDSLGIAAGGDLREQQVASQFFLGLRQLGVTSLLITHVAKESLSNSRTPYGSIYFRNLARNVWQVKKTQEAGQGEISIGLYHDKSNDGQLSMPIGLRVMFGNDSVKVQHQDVSSVPELACGLPLRERIKGVLRQGAMTVKEIAEELGKNQEEVRARLNQYKNIFVKVDATRWGLLSYDYS
jgi:hypothetical protein